MSTPRWTRRCLTGIASALSLAATALGPELNVHFDDASGTLVPTAPAYAFQPSRFLRPFDQAGAK
jgi:hypothetical protein